MGIKLIIAGSRGCDPTDEQITAEVARMLCLASDDQELATKIRACVEEVISGDAPGVDRSGDRWARSLGISVHHEPITEEDVRRFGKWMAPKMRNRRMAERATHALCFWDGMSSGTPDMAIRMVIRGKPVHAVPCKRARKSRAKSAAESAHAPN